MKPLTREIQGNLTVQHVFRHDPDKGQSSNFIAVRIEKEGRLLAELQIDRESILNLSLHMPAEAKLFVTEEEDNS